MFDVHNIDTFEKKFKKHGNFFCLHSYNDEITPRLRNSASTVAKSILLCIKCRTGDNCSILYKALLPRESLKTSPLGIVKSTCALSMSAVLAGGDVFTPFINSLFS